jgi:hypothetical protein
VVVTVGSEGALSSSASSKIMPTAQISRAAPKGAFVYLPSFTG